MANSKIEAVEIALRNIFLSFNINVAQHRAKVLAGVAIDASNKWDKDHAIRWAFDAPDAPASGIGLYEVKDSYPITIEQRLGRLEHELKQCQQGFQAQLHSEIGVLRNHGKRLGKLEVYPNEKEEIFKRLGELGDKEHNNRVDIVALNKAFASNASRLGLLEKWKRKVCGQDD